jgi:hypothetical protein
MYDILKVNFGQIERRNKFLQAKNADVEGVKPMEEENKRFCSYCLEQKTWQWQGLRLKDGSKIYVDQKSMRWSGKRCPDCERRRVRQALSIDSFNRNLVIQELQRQGYEILNSELPIQVSRGGKNFKIVIKKAFADGGQIIVDESINLRQDKSSDEILVFLFQSIRILGQDQLERLRPNMRVMADVNDLTLV